MCLGRPPALGSPGLLSGDRLVHSVPVWLVQFRPRGCVHSVPVWFTASVLHKAPVTPTTQSRLLLAHGTGGSLGARTPLLLEDLPGHDGMRDSLRAEDHTKVEAHPGWSMGQDRRPGLTSLRTCVYVCP